MCLKIILALLLVQRMLGTSALSVAQLLITSISLSNDVISQVANYNFQIVRYGTSTSIPSGSTVQISFPNAYTGISITGCTKAGWVGATTLTCSYSQLKLLVSGGFPYATSIQSFGVEVSGIKNPPAAKTYSFFTVRLIYPNGTEQTGSGSYSVTITTANATCSMTLNTGLVFSEGQLTISYSSQFISSSSSGFTMKLSMLQSYPSDPSNTDIKPTLSVSNTMLATYLFQFAFTTQFSINLLMPPSTQPEENFIYIMTSNVLGDYDKCFITISGVQPNQFTYLNFGTVEVQSLANLNIGLRATTPILTSDLIRVDFGASEFVVSGVGAMATFIKGVIGQRQVTKSSQILTIRNIASFVIVEQLAFYLQNIGFPYSLKPQSVTIYIETQTGFIRSLQTYAYVGSAGTLLSKSFTCLTSEIGFTTACTLNLVLGNQIRNNSYVQIKFPIAFKISNGYSQCTISGTSNSLNSLASCNSYSLTNSIRISGFISTPTLSPGTSITIILSSISLPTTPSSYTLQLSTKTTDSYTIDSASLTFMTIPRQLLAGEISISSSQSTTGTVTVYSVTLNLPISLAVSYVMSLYIPFNTVGTPSVNNNLLQSSYSASSGILTINGVISTVLTITGFYSSDSTAPTTLIGNLSYSGVRYFYFTGYDITMQIPKQISTLTITQSNTIVGEMFIADIVISDLTAGDVVKLPTQYYAITQPNCSSNCVCQSNGIVRVNTVGNAGLGLTKISVNLINNGYISISTFNITTLTSSTLYKKQTKQSQIRTQTPNVLTIAATQSNPYYLQSSLYTFTISMKTQIPSTSTNNFLTVLIPNQYTIQQWSCLFGCTAPSPPVNGGVLYFQISSTNVSFTVKIVNPVAFLSMIKMTSSSFGDMDYGDYLPTTPCSSPCRSCSQTPTQCQTCYLWSSLNKLRQQSCIGECPVGQFYNTSSYSCQGCHSYCLSCVNTSTTCYTCKPDYFYFQYSCLVVCPIGYFGASGECTKCSTDCLTCLSFTQCTKCSNGSYLYQGACWASCEQGTYINPLVNQCVDCSPNCVRCDSSGCQSCSSSYYLYNLQCYQECPTGLYKSSTRCQQCQPPCKSCSSYSNNCTSCLSIINATKYYYLGNQCYQNSCPDTFYVSPADNVCLQCQPPCLNCNHTQCLTCRTDYYYYRGFCVLDCPAGAYPQSTGMLCIACAAECATCLSSSICLSCVSPYHFHNSQCLASCPIGHYPQPLQCLQCTTPCLTCTSASLCLSCSSLSLFNSTCYSSCPSGYYSSPSPIPVLNTTVKQCLKCVAPCVSCLSSSSCLSCPQTLKLHLNQCLSTCPQFYYDLNGICYACSLPCKTCNSSGCLTCASDTQYLQKLQCLNACTQLHPNNRTMVCEACRDPCSSCTWSDTCLSCVDPYIYYGGECIRTCPAGMYNNNQQCLSCPNLCATCYLSSSDQIRCRSCLSPNIFYGYTCVSSCPQNTTLQSPFCLSASCQTLTNCTTCSNMRCLECQTNFTLNQNTNKCEQIPTDSTVISAISQIPVPFPFLIATVVIIVCGFLIRIEFNKMFTPLFIYCFVGVAEAGAYGLWLVLVYLRGVNQEFIGLVLKIAASGVAGIYVLFNLLSFICYIKITRNDKKYKTWQKQDNRCTSILITILSLLLSFRLSLLKYSKLGHLQKFSATLTHDSNLSHQTLIALLSIPLLSLPTVVISAWIAYLQTKMNYLFFTSLQIAVISVIMIVLSIVQSLSPKGYTLEKREEFRQGHDSDHVDGHSLSQMMVKMGVVEEEYHQGQEIGSEEDQVGNRNQMAEQLTENNMNTIKTGNPLIHTKAQDQKLSYDSDINQSQDTQARQNQRNQRLEQQMSQLQNIILRAEERTRELSRPIRQYGLIKKQTLQSLQDQYQSEQIESDDQPPPINSVSRDRLPKNQSLLRREQELDLKEMKSMLDVEERRMGMKRLEQLFQQLKMQEMEEKQLRERLDKVTKQEKMLKQNQFQKARQAIERNQMSIEDKMSKVQQLLQNRTKNDKQRKQRIQQLQKQRRQERSQRMAEQSKRKDLVYPINEQIDEYTNLPKKIEVEKRKGALQNQNSKGNQQAIQQRKEMDWQQSPNLIFQKNKDWKIGTQRQSPGLKGKLQQKSNPNPSQNPSQASPNNLLAPSQRQPIISQPFEQLQMDHWPIDPELQQKINEVEQRADRYIRQNNKNKKKKPIVQEFDIQLESDLGTGTEEFIYEEELGDLDDGGQAEDNYLDVGDKKMPKNRVNRNVIDLSPN